MTGVFLNKQTMRTVVLLAVVLFLFSAGGATLSSAQEGSCPPGTVWDGVKCVAPTETPTPIPYISPTPSPTPTATSTSTPTATPTNSPTPTATNTPTNTPAPRPTLDVLNNDVWLALHEAQCKSDPSSPILSDYQRTIDTWFAGCMASGKSQEECQRLEKLLNEKLACTSLSNPAFCSDNKTAKGDPVACCLVLSEKKTIELSDWTSGAVGDWALWAERQRIENAYLACKCEGKTTNFGRWMCNLGRWVSAGAWYFVAGVAVALVWLAGGIKKAWNWTKKAAAKVGKAIVSAAKKVWRGIDRHFLTPIWDALKWRFGRHGRAVRKARRVSKKEQRRSRKR